MKFKIINENNKRTEYHHHKNIKDVNDINKSLTSKENYFLSDGNSSKPYRVKPDNYNYDGLLYSDIILVRQKPMAYIEVWKEQDRNAGCICIATRNDDEARHKGYAQKLLDGAIDWFKTKSTIDKLNWGSQSDNFKSINLAKKNGFEFIRDKNGHTLLSLDKDK